MPKPNQAPVAVLTLPDHAVVGEVVPIDTTGSHDPNGKLKGVRVEVDDALPDTTPAGKTPYVFARPGTFTVKATAVDTQGKTHVVAKKITITAAPIVPVEPPPSTEPPKPELPPIVIVGEPEVPPVSGARQLLTSSALQYLGVFGVPGSGQPWLNESHPLNVSVGAITGRVVNGETRLFLSGPRQGSRQPGPMVMECAVPSTLGASIAEAPPANERARYADIWRDRATVAAVGGYAILYGLHLDGDTLYSTYSTDYEGNSHNPSLVAFDLKTGTVSGPWKTAAHSGSTSGYLTPLPASLGFAFGVGTPIHTSVVTAPFGCNLHGVATPDPAKADVQTTALVYRDLSNPQPRDPANIQLCAWNVQYVASEGGTLRQAIPVWGGGLPGNCLDYCETCVWIDLPDVHGVLFFGHLVGEGHSWYGLQTCPHGHVSPTTQGTGPGATRLINTGWIYDPADLEATAKGQHGADVPLPRETFKASALGFVSDQCYQALHFGGAWFEPVSRKLYVTEVGQDTRTLNMSLPVIHVFQV